MKCGSCQEQIEEDIELPHLGMCKSCMKKTLHRLEKNDPFEVQDE